MSIARRPFSKELSQRLESVSLSSYRSIGNRKVADGANGVRGVWFSPTRKENYEGQAGVSIHYPTLVPRVISRAGTGQYRRHADGCNRSCRRICESDCDPNLDRFNA